MRAPAARMRSVRRRWGLCALLQIHHVIPQQWAHHPAVTRCGFDVHGRDNLLFMPTRIAASNMRLRDGRLVHDGGHMRYNVYVRYRLDETVDDCHDLHALVYELRHRLRATRSDLPWR